MIEANNSQGNTPLHLASLRDHLPVVKALLSGGANIFAANSNGEFPIHYAVTSRGFLPIQTVILFLFRKLVFRHFILRFTGMCWVQMMSWGLAALPGL
jgi:hypothetical protein